MSVPVRSTEHKDNLCHAIDNRMQSLMLSISVIDHYATDEIRHVTQIMQREIDELRALVSELKTTV